MQRRSSIYYSFQCILNMPFTHTHTYTYADIHIHIPTHTLTYTYTYLHIRWHTHTQREDTETRKHWWLFWHQSDEDDEKGKHISGINSFFCHSLSLSLSRSLARSRSLQTHKDTNSVTRCQIDFFIIWLLTTINISPKEYKSWQSTVKIVPNTK